jgi:hypothetical protein
MNKVLLPWLKWLRLLLALLLDLRGCPESLIVQVEEQLIVIDYTVNG